MFVSLFFFLGAFAENRVKVNQAFKFEASPRWISETSNAVDQNNEITVIFALRQEGVYEMLRKLDKVADPTHPAHYGKYWSVNQMNKNVRPSSVCTERVRRFIDSQNGYLSNASANNGFMSTVMTVKDAQQAFQVHFEEFRPVENSLEQRRSIFRSRDAYTLPVSIRQCVDFVDGINGWPISLATKGRD